MSGNLAPRFAMVIYAPQVIAIGHGREGAVQGKDFQAVAGKVEIADDLRPQQRDHVRADREFEAGKDLLGHGGPAQHVAALQYYNFLAGTRKIGGIGEPVVPAANHDCVIFRSRAVGRSHRKAVLANDFRRTGVDFSFY